MKVVYFSIANTVSYQKHAYFDATSGNFAEILTSQDVLQFFPGESMQD